MAEKKLNLRVKTKGTDKAKKEIKGVEGSLKSLGKQAVVAGAAFFGARAVTSGLKKVIDLAGRQELAEKKLEAALGKTSNTLLAQAKALQQVTMFGDENIIEAQAMLAAFTDEEDQIAKLTKATIDLAAAKGFDLVSAADLVAKSFGSSTNALTRYGIEVIGAVGSTERLETLTGNVAKLFGGQAAAQADTMTGSIEQMKNAMSDTGEVIGSLLAPAIIDISKGIKSIAEAIDINRIKGYATAISLVATGLVSAKIATIGLAKSLRILRIATVKTGIGALVVALGELASTFYEKLSPAIDETNSKLVSLRENTSLVYLQTLTDKLTNAVRNWGEETSQAQVKAVAYALGIESEGVRFKELIPLLFKTIQLKKEEAKVAAQGSKSKQDTLIKEAGAWDVIFGMYKTSIKLTKEQISQQRKLSMESAITTGEMSSNTLEAVRSVIKAYFAQAVAGMLKEEISNKGLPGLITGAIGASAAMGLFESLVPKFHSGGEVPAILQTGEFVLSREAVQSIGIDTARRINEGRGTGATINIYGGVVQDDYIRNELLPAINRAEELS